MIIAILVLLCWPLASQAGLINNGTYITDTSSNLDWYRWDLTNNKSYNYVSGQFGSGGEFEGYRYATNAEASTFLSQFGFGSYGPSWSGNSESAWTELTSYMGKDTTYRTDIEYIYGMVEETVSMAAYTFAHFDNIDQTSYDPQWQHMRRFYGKNSSYSFLGSFLVQDSSAAVPEPTTLALMGLGLAGIGWRRKVKAQR